MANLKDVFNTLLKRKQDICKEIDSLKYKGKMFPPIAKQPCAGANAKPDQSSLTDCVPQLFSSTPSSAQEETEESWTINHDEEVYNIEFNVEPKVSASSKQSSSRLTKQSSHYDGFENVHEVCSYDENQWTKYYDNNDDDDDENGSNVIMAATKDFAHGDVFTELLTTEVDRNSSSDNEGSVSDVTEP